VDGDLSPREKEVAALLERRLCNKEIGSALGICERTVRFHLGNIFKKLGVSDRYSLIDLLRTSGVGGAQSVETTDQGRLDLPAGAGKVLREAA
jgi:DNA-binding CsgD family transcriptional regulator